MKKRRVILRIFPFNRITFPVLLRSWETRRIDSAFEVVISQQRPRPRPDDVILYSFMTPFLPLIAAEIQAINRPDIIIAAGGPHATGDQELTRRIGFDIIFIGEGEQNFIDFGRDLREGNIAKEFRIYQPPSRSVMSRYLPLSRYLKTIPPLELTRGCPRRCRFCATSRIPAAQRDYPSVIRYMDALRGKGVERINFITSGNLSRQAVVSVIEAARARAFAFIEFGIFPSEIRPERIEEKLLTYLRKRVSNRSLTIGAQSGASSRLKSLGRDHEPREVIRSVGLINQAGFRANVDFIIGTPGETPAEFNRTLDFIRCLKKKFRVTVQVHFFFPLPGTPLGFARPRFLDPSQRTILQQAGSDGLITGGWQKNEQQSAAYLEWLGRRHPDYHHRFG